MQMYLGFFCQPAPCPPFLVSIIAPLQSCVVDSAGSIRRAGATASRGDSCGERMPVFVSLASVRRGRRSALLFERGRVDESTIEYYQDSFKFHKKIHAISENKVVGVVFSTGFAFPLLARFCERHVASYLSLSIVRCFLCSIFSSPLFSISLRYIPGYKRLRPLRWRTYSIEPFRWTCRKKPTEIQGGCLFLLTLPAFGQGT